MGSNSSHLCSVETKGSEGSARFSGTADVPGFTSVWKAIIVTNLVASLTILKQIK